MARAIEQIERELTQLKERSLLLGKELEDVYRKYFAVLTTAIEKQTTQACYYLCTNDYPEAFLQLSYGQREHLLKSMQRVIKHSNTDLNSKLISPQIAEGQTDPTAVNLERFATPEELYNWQKEVERSIQKTNQLISHKINLLLHQSRILPTHLPNAILEASAKGGERGENMTDVPNILSILVEEKDNDDEDDDDESERRSGIVKLDILYLRLTEIEFVDMVVMSWRKQVNQLASKVANLRREYHNKQKELKIAEAESAWRNSWFD
jgi:hypothetical protein